MTVKELIDGLKKLHGTSETMELIADTIILLKEQEARIKELEENCHFTK